MQSRKEIQPLEKDGNLFDIVYAIQQGNTEAQWLFTEHKKIRAIIKKRISDYAKMFYWLPKEDLEDIECGLRPRLIALAQEFELPELRNEGRVVSYFHLRIKGEADNLLKKISGMRQVSDEEGNQYLKSPVQADTSNIDIDSGMDIDNSIIDNLEDQRQTQLVSRLLSRLNEESAQLWLRCYYLKLVGKTWAEITAELGYKSTEYLWIKENTLRFVSRMKDALIHMGESISARICGIFTDESDVGICILDTQTPKNFVIWSKHYEHFNDLDKIEAKLGDIYRQFDITYVVTNELEIENRAFVIIMRYLHKRESYVELVNLAGFSKLLASVPSVVRGYSLNSIQKSAYLLAKVKLSHLELVRENARRAAQRDS